MWYGWILMEFCSQAVAYIFTHDTKAVLISFGNDRVTYSGILASGADSMDSLVETVEGTLRHLPGFVTHFSNQKSF